EVSQAAQHTAESGLAGAIGVEAERRRATAAKDGHHGEEFSLCVAQGSHTEMCPIRLGLLAGCGLEADLRILDQWWTQPPEVADERRIAADVSIARTQLGVQSGPANRRAGSDPAGEVGLLGVVELGGRSSLCIAALARAGQLA